jgi:hypothetical protein
MRVWATYSVFGGLVCHELLNLLKLGEDVLVWIVGHIYFYLL